jgi:hypothetical protein
LISVAASPSSRRACSIIDGDASTPITLPRGSRSISFRVTRPLPQPASMTVSSPLSGTRSSSIFSAHPAWKEETW